MTHSERRDGADSPGRTAGFGQIEVLTAMLVLGLATPFLIGTAIGGLAQAGHSQDRDLAVLWARGEFDFLRGQCFVRLAPRARKVTAAGADPGEPPPPAGFSAAYVQIAPAGPGLLRATIGLYRHDWAGPIPATPPFLAARTYIADIRVAGLCP